MVDDNFPKCGVSPLSPRLRLALPGFAGLMSILAFGLGALQAEIGSGSFLGRFTLSRPLTTINSSSWYADVAVVRAARADHPPLRATQIRGGTACRLHYGPKSLERPAIQRGMGLLQPVDR